MPTDFTSSNLNKHRLKKTFGFGLFARDRGLPSQVVPRAGCCAGVILLAGMLPQLAQTNFVPLVTNGPASNRLNVVFLSEGYTSNQLGTFLADATNSANILLTTAPFAEYAPYLNCFAIAVASAQSGSDHPVSLISRNTYFNSTYGSSDYIMSIPPNEFDANYSNGQGKVDALLNTFMPAADLAILLVNDPNIGGSDGGGKTAIAAVSFALGDILLHESGHVLAGLGDEYTTPNSGYPDIEEPNTTRETNRAAIKWNAWISTNTPVPTPTSYGSAVGLFEGAHYHTTGWYRPKLNCRMSSPFYNAFCEVCSEALVLSIYRKVRPIDSFAPAATNLLVTAPGVLSFALTALQPTGHALGIQWLTNGTPVPDATNSTFAILSAAVGNSTLTVAGRLLDPTPLVRTDPSNWLGQTITWTATISLPQLQLTTPRWLGAGGFTFRVTGVAPQGFALLASTNLINWQPVATNSLVGGSYDYTNTSATNRPLQFFRAVTPP